MTDTFVQLMPLPSDWKAEYFNDASCQRSPSEDCVGDISAPAVALGLTDDGKIKVLVLHSDGTVNAVHDTPNFYRIGSMLKVSSYLGT